MSARYAIVEVDPIARRDEILGLLTRNYPDDPAVWVARFPKYYERNPAGAPLVFFAEEAGSGRAVGMTALFPAILRVEGEPVLGAIGADFAVDREHRGFGPAVALQRDSLAAMGAAGLRFVYGCPNVNSDPVMNRVGIGPVGALTRFVKILRTRGTIEAHVRPRAVARIAGAISPLTADPLLALLSPDRRARPPAGYVVERPERFDDRFLPVFESSWRRHRFVFERTPALMNWRYDKLGDPEREAVYAIYALVAGTGEVGGYVVSRTIGRTRYVLDLDAVPGEGLLDALILTFVRDARSERADAVSFTCLAPSGDLEGRLRALGFAARPGESLLRIHAFDEALRRPDLNDPAHWFFVAGDNDI